MAQYGTHNLEIPDGSDRASATVAFSEFTNTLDPVLDAISTQADNAASSVGEVSDQYGSLSATVAQQATSISNLNTKTTNLAKAGTVLVVRLTADFHVGTDAAHITLPFDTVDYRHPSGTFANGVWTAPAAGRVRVTAGAMPCYGSAWGAADLQGFPSILSIVKSGTLYRIGQVGAHHNFFILNGSTTFTVAAGNQITAAIYMNAINIYKTVRASPTDDNGNFMMIEYLRDAEIS